MNISREEISQFIKKYEVATNSHDFSNVSELIHPDAIYRFTDGDFVGIDAIGKAFESTWNSIKDETYSISNLSIVFTDTNSATFTYTFNWTGIVGGERKSGNGRGTNVIVRNGNKLQSIFEHLSK